MANPNRRKRTYAQRREQGHFAGPGGGGDQGDHTTSYALIRRATINRMNNLVTEGNTVPQAARAVAGEIADMPGHRRPVDMRPINEAIQQLPNVVTTRAQHELLNGFYRATLSLAQQNPAGATRFGSTGGGEGSHLKGLADIEKRIQAGRPFIQEKAARHMRGLYDASAFHRGVEAQHAAHNEGDEQNAHFPGYIAGNDNHPDHDEMRRIQVERTSRYLRMAFPLTADTVDSRQVIAEHIETGGNQDRDPSFTPTAPVRKRRRF